MSHGSSNGNGIIISQAFALHNERKPRFSTIPASRDSIFIASLTQPLSRWATLDRAANSAALIESVETVKASREGLQGGRLFALDFGSS